MRRLAPFGCNELQSEFWAVPVLFAKTAHFMSATILQKGNELNHQNIGVL
jgi:hypothetical protein